MERIKTIRDLAVGGLYSVAYADYIPDEEVTMFKISDNKMLKVGPYESGRPFILLGVYDPGLLSLEEIVELKILYKNMIGWIRVLMECDVITKLT